MGQTLYKQQRRLMAIDKCLGSGAAFKIRGELDRKCNLMLQAEELGPYSWRQYYDDINFMENHYNAPIERANAIDLCYKPFDMQATRVTVSPYHLKQYNGRWFLIAFREDGDGGLIRHYALDRIEDIQDNAKAQYRPTDIDFGEYFFPVIGVTIPEGGEVQTITLRVRRREYPYIETKPLHVTQEKLCEDGDSVTITIEVMVNFELKQRLLSHADYVTVIAPQSLREEMKSLIKKMWSNYDN